MAAALASASTTSACFQKRSAFKPVDQTVARTHICPSSTLTGPKSKHHSKHSLLRATQYRSKDLAFKFLIEEQRSLKRKTRAGLIKASMAIAEETTKTSAADGKPKLYDAPISNNGARVRFVIYGKGLEDEIEMAKPADLGGLKSEAYLALNPEGKMPLLVTPEGEGIPESKVISKYILDTYRDKGPSFEPEPENKLRCSLIERIHDLYIAANQGSMYRAMDPSAREQGLREIAKQLRILERYAKAEPYLAGPSETVADHAVFPTMVFIDYIMPRVYGWNTYLDDKPKLKKWWTFMSEQPVGRRIRDEIEGALQSWVESGRFEKLGITDLVKENPKRFTVGALEAAA